MRPTVCRLLCLSEAVQMRTRYLVAHPWAFDPRDDTETTITVPK
jgi:hypothetical protein